MSTLGIGVGARLELARAAAEEAGRGTLQWFRNPDLMADMKGDGSPVTRADREAEELIRKRIGEAFPEDGIIGEEFGKTEGNSGFTWVLDPIDGTKAFVRGIPTFSNLVAVVREGRAVVGVANFPALNELVYAGAGGGAWWMTGSGDTRQARLSSQDKLDDSVIEVASPWTFMRDGTWDKYEELARRGAKLRGWNDAYGFALVATGRVDAAVDLGIKVWDIAPFDVIVREAGGWMTDWKGHETLDTDRVVMCNGALRDQLTGLLA